MLFRSITWPTGVTTFFGYIAAGNDYIELFGNGDAGVNSSFEIDDWPVADEVIIRVTGSYETDEA